MPEEDSESSVEFSDNSDDPSSGPMDYEGSDLGGDDPYYSGSLGSDFWDTLNSRPSPIFDFEDWTANGSVADFQPFSPGSLPPMTPTPPPAYEPPPTYEQAMAEGSSTRFHGVHTLEELAQNPRFRQVYFNVTMSLDFKDIVLNRFCLN